jgi:hypothetical protein
MRNDIHAPGAAPTRPLRADPRLLARPDAQGPHPRRPATSGGVVRATLGSALAAAAIPVFLWLLSEDTVDPTCVGRVLGLTGMGAIKQQLCAEAAADDAVLAAEADDAVLAAEAVPTQAPASSDPALMERLDALETQLSAIAAIAGPAPVSPEVATAPDAAADPAAPGVETAPAPADCRARVT